MCRSTAAGSRRVIMTLLTAAALAMKEMAMEDAGAGRNLMPGQVDVEAEVSATFSIQ